MTLEAEFEDYENFKKQLSTKGKLTPYKKLIEKMIKDEISQKDMMKFLNEKYNIKVTQSNFSLFVRKLKEKKIVKMELVNGGVLPVAAVPVASKKPIKKEVQKIEKVENKIATKKVAVEEPKELTERVPFYDNDKSWKREEPKKRLFEELREPENFDNSNIIVFEGKEYNLNNGVEKINYELAVSKSKKD